MILAKANAALFYSLLGIIPRRLRRYSRESLPDWQAGGSDKNSILHNIIL
jgi:hypothetical protein